MSRKKQICCFFFFFLFLIGFLGGALASGWLYPGTSGVWKEKQSETEKTGETEAKTRTLSVQTLETWKAGGITLAELEKTGKRYPGTVWKKRLFGQYLLYFILTVALLEITKKPLPVLLFWLLYGTASGIYARGLFGYYGRLGNYYGLTALLVIPSVLALLTGVFWVKPGLEAGVVYLPYQKRIRDMLLALRIRILPSCFYAAALLLCYVADYEIVKRIQWRILLRMLRNVVN